MTSHFNCLTCGQIIYTTERPMYQLWMIQLPLIAVSLWHRWFVCQGAKK